MTEQSILVYKRFLSKVKNSTHPALSQQPLYKNWATVDTLLFEKLVGVSTPSSTNTTTPPPPHTHTHTHTHTPAETGGWAHYVVDEIKSTAFLDIRSGSSNISTELARCLEKRTLKTDQKQIQKMLHTTNTYVEIYKLEMTNVDDNFTETQKSANSTNRIWYLF